MEIGDWQATSSLNPLFRDIREFGLEGNVAELDAYGFTVVPADVAAPSGFAQRLLDRVLQVSEQRSGVAPDRETGSTHANAKPTGEHLFYLLMDGREFEEAVMNPVVLSLITYLLGESCLLSSVTSIIKGPGLAPLAIHSDNSFIPAPFPQYAQVANATWLLSDYTKENGALCFVPGSHRRCRQPATLQEFYPSDANTDAIPVEAPMGSLVIWHGNAWHGAYPRTTPGLRVNLILYFCRMYIQTQERYRGNVPADMIERNGPRFAKLVGEHLAYGWQAEGPDYAKLSIVAKDVHA